MLLIFYGRGEKYIDITSDVAECCFDGEEVLIPGDDFLRAKMFTDPVYGVEKEIVVIRSDGDEIVCRSYPGSAAVNLRLDDAEKRAVGDRRPTRNPARIALPPSEMTSEDEKIAFIHEQLDFIGGSLEDELPEQRMAVRFIEPTAKVLELGANIGRNTLMIASILEDSRNLVTLECAPGSARVLRMNRWVNNFQFHIEVSALSYRKLIQQGWNTIPSDELLPGYSWVNTITFEEICRKHELRFDTIVADCEGALFYILQDNPDILRHIGTVIVESDYLSVDHKRSVTGTFERHGFARVYSEQLVVDWDHPFPEECAASFYEVWQRAPTR